MKKLLKITGAFAFMVALFFTVSLNGETESGNLDLASLTKMTEANAECILIPYAYPNGECSWDGNCWVGGRPEFQNCTFQ